ncbi:hypothetical protein GGR57DRAFT_491998 [Xylariaceae sp. FL1272]|nr:hypothetical protein GGR57DRAFT_491998 [Xylariaceae sp. FL1272]
MDDSKRIAELEELIREAEERFREAEERFREAKERRREAERRLDEMKQQSRPTTLDEYIAACHNLLFSRLVVKQDKSSTSGGPVGNPQNKLCPSSLEPWTDFLQQQRMAFGQLRASFSADRQVFKNRTFLTGLGDRVSQSAITNKKRLKYFLLHSIEYPVSAIMTELAKKAEVHKQFNIGAPHKLTAPHLRLGLHPMKIFDKIVNRKTVPTAADPDEQFRYYAKRLTAAALIQTYYYMIYAGLEYGLLTTGEATVFLKVDWKSPRRYITILLNPNPRMRAITRVGTWAQDFETTLRSTPAVGRRAPDSCIDSPDYPPTTHSKADRSPILLRREARRPGTDRASVQKTSRQDSPSTSDDETTPKPPDPPSPASTPHTARRSQRALVQRPREGDDQNRQYCTQRCLLGLVKGDVLDPRCPNVARHLIRYGEWLRLLSRQFVHFLDHGVIELGINISIFLGAIDLRSIGRTYYYDYRVYITHMTFFSWGWYSLDRDAASNPREQELEAKALRVLGAIHQEGVVHRDVRLPNMVLNPETQELMLIDFERALLSVNGRHAAVIDPEP